MTAEAKDIQHIYRSGCQLDEAVNDVKGTDAKRPWSASLEQAWPLIGEVRSELMLERDGDYYVASFEKAGARVKVLGNRPAAAICGAYLRYVELSAGTRP